MDFADSCLVLLVEKLNIQKVATVGRDFSIYRFNGRMKLKIIFNPPSKLSKQRPAPKGHFNDRNTTPPEPNKSSLNRECGFQGPIPWELFNALFNSKINCNRKYRISGTNWYCCRSDIITILCIYPIRFHADFIESEFMFFQCDEPGKISSFGRYKIWLI